MPPRGLRPHTHDERMAVARALVPAFRRRFGEGLLGVALSASVARGDDRAFSDLELVVFLRDPPPPGEDAYLQRIVDGMLVEAVYWTEEAYLAQFATLAADWYLAGSETLVPLDNPELVERIARQVRAVRHPRAHYLLRAGRRFVEVQESFGKTLSAIDAGDGEAVGLLLWDAMHHSLVTLAFLNEHAFRTFARFIPEARAFPLKPPRYDELLDRMVAGDWQGPGLRELLLEVYAGMEQLFAAEGVDLYDADLDPGKPNRRYL